MYTASSVQMLAAVAIDANFPSPPRPVALFAARAAFVVTAFVQCPPDVMVDPAGTASLLAPDVLSNVLLLKAAPTK